MLAANQFSLSRQFLVMSMIILVTGMLIIGSWISRQIEQSVLDRTAAITALYVDSFISPKLQSLAQKNSLDASEIAELNYILSDTPLSQQIVSFKVWSPEGQVLYNPSQDLIGRQYAIVQNLAEAFEGKVTTSLSSLTELENDYERQHWEELIETYAPVRALGSEEIIAVSEFYQLPDDLFQEVRQAQFQSWLIVGVATFGMYVLLAGFVGRGSKTIMEQQVSLEKRLKQVQELLTQNQQLNQKVRKAAIRTTALNERFLSRISADLHDGPVQDMALASMQIEPLEEGIGLIREQVSKAENLLSYVEIISNGLTSAMEELRIISTGLRLPELENLSVEEVANRVVRGFERKTGLKIPFQADQLPELAPLEVKITIYRVIQESLANSLEHAGGAKLSVKVWKEKDNLSVLVSDNGKGFDLNEAGRDGHLGLIGMRERVELLGGLFLVETLPGEGTSIFAVVPLGDSVPKNNWNL